MYFNHGTLIKEENETTHHPQNEQFHRLRNRQIKLLPTPPQNSLVPTLPPRVSLPHLLPPSPSKPTKTPSTIN